MPATEELNDQDDDDDDDKSDCCDTTRLNKRARRPRSCSSTSLSSDQLELAESVRTVQSACSWRREDSPVDGERATQLENQKSAAAREREASREVSEQQAHGCDQRAHNERAQSPRRLSKRQILSAENLLDDAGRWPAVADIDPKEQNDDYERIQREESVARDATPDARTTRSRPEDDGHQSIAMISPDHTYNHHAASQQPPQASQIRGFGQVQPRLSATSKRMRDYIETFRRRRQQRTSYERSRAYQFFKCARTELVASLLFSLIVCYILISCKTTTTTTTPTSPLLKKSPLQPASRKQTGQPSQDEVSSDQVHAYLEHAAKIQESTRVQVHLTTGLVAAFAVATLTQVFGHVSGCHLLPSVSLALYLKGHISRARLVAYLGAQSAGSLLGVALLALLTSSQVTTVQYLTPSPRVALNGSLGSSPGAVDKLVMLETSRMHRTDALERRKRSPEQAPLAGSNNFTIGNKQELANIARGDDERELHSPVTPASETILMSIEEQRERELAAKRQRHHARQQSDTSPAPSSGNGDGEDGSFGDHLRVSAPGERRISNVNASVQRVAPQSGSSSSSTTARGLIASEQVAPGTETRANNAPGEGAPRARVISSKQVAAARPEAGGQRLVMVPLNSDFAGGAPAAASVRNEDFPRASTALPESAHELDPPAPPLKRDGEAPARAPIDGAAKLSPLQQPAHRAQRTHLKRKKRARRKQQANASNTSGAEEESGERSVRAIRVNLLQLALPDEIMTSDSVRECLRANQDTQREEQEQETTTSERRLNRCLGVSNGSQMFIFQLLATLLVNLAYLVNVDPRRTDLGYKSLSIGLAYFLAHALTLNSGGFCGSPVQLLALASLATRDPASPSSSLWHSEWAIYLIVPLIGGLFSAISHEYIDFTSARNRNKTALGLRRSFFSLEDVRGAEGGGVADSANSLATPTSEIGHLDNDEPRGPRAATRRKLHAASGPATGDASPTQRPRRHKRLSSAATTSSDDGHGSMGANSSLATLHLTDLNNNNNNNSNSDNNNNQHSSHEPQLKSVSSGYLRTGRCGEPAQRRSNARSRTAGILLDSNFLISCPVAASRAHDCQPAAARASSTNRRTQRKQQQQVHPPSQFTCTSQFM